MKKIYSFIFDLNILDTGVKNASNPCEYPLEPGGCGNSNDMWYYDRVTGQCGSFLYSGCQGNLNNFHSRAECEDWCTGMYVCMPHYALCKVNKFEATSTPSMHTI